MMKKFDDQEGGFQRKAPPMKFRDERGQKSKQNKPKRTRFKEFYESDE